MKIHRNIPRRMTALLLAAALGAGTLPSAFAAQQNSYHDPAEHWQEAANRTEELDVNAVVTHETFDCAECEKPTMFTVWRTPEYTRDGATAMTRNVRYSDGTMVDGVGKGRILDGTPGEDAYYTGYHWTKSVCETCGVLNADSHKGSYGYNKNIFTLYDCASSFFENLPETKTVEQVDSTHHRVTTASGKYCGFCYGTHKEENAVLERHRMESAIRPELAHDRFVAMNACADCDYSETAYTAAKAVIADYFGVVDGQPHTVTVSDLSEAGVTTAIRYGHTAESCTLTSAPNFTKAGDYPVYYKITYTFKNTDMVEDGVAFVHLRGESAEETDGDGTCGEKHNWTLLESVDPTCLTLGYDRYLCVNCGKTEKRDYKTALGHAYQSSVIRDATCETPGKTLEICQRCSDTKETVLPKGAHKFATSAVTATCTTPGYTLEECSVCGERNIKDITTAVPHNYMTKVTPATCEGGGKTLHLCEGCGSSFFTDYTDPLGHRWDEGHEITGASCTGGGMTEYTCTRCNATRLEGDPAAGHVPGAAATCTKPQVCTVCGVVLQLPVGHKPSDWIVDKAPTTDSAGSQHKECTVCGETLESEEIEKIYNQSTTDSKGEAVVGGYLVTVSDTDTKNPVAGATVTLSKENALSVRLPDGRLLDYADQTTVTVQLVKDKSAVPDMATSVTDKHSNYAAGKTDKAGQLTVPMTSGTTNGSGDATVGWEDADGARHTLTVKVERHETGRPITAAGVAIGKSGNITVTLPSGEDMSESHRITVTVTDNERKPQADRTVIVKSDLGKTEQGQTKKDGKLTVPDMPETEQHGAYIVGYPNGTFGADRNMRRSEAAAIFARLLAQRNDERVPVSAAAAFPDVPSGAWYAAYVSYLTRYGVSVGYTDGLFHGDDPITRAEFTAMAVRFFDAYGDGGKERTETYQGFWDVSPSHWAAGYIENAAQHGWVEGYGNGAFAPEEKISRAEVVTIVNRLLEREADRDYIASSPHGLVQFPDVSGSHWAYYDILEAANRHEANVSAAPEVWQKK